MVSQERRGLQGFAKMCMKDGAPVALKCAKNELNTKLEQVAKANSIGLFNKRLIAKRIAKKMAVDQIIK